MKPEPTQCCAGGKFYILETDHECARFIAWEIRDWPDARYRSKEEYHYSGPWRPCSK